MADRYSPIEGCRGGSNPIIGSSGTSPAQNGIDNLLGLDDAVTLCRILGCRPGHRHYARLHQAVNELGILGVAGLDPYGLKAQLGLPLPMARRLVGILELARRLTVSRRPDTALLKTPESVRELMAPALVHLAHEQFWCLPVNARNCLIGSPRMVSRGDVDGTEAGPRTFLREGLLAHASGVIAVHNHPSGDPTPSPSDRAITRRLAEAGRLVDLPLLDHVVIGDGGRFTSLRRECPEVFR